MTVLNIELIDPRAKSLLEELAKLNLIRIQEEPKPNLDSIVERIRDRVEEQPIPEAEVREEVEKVRAEQATSHPDEGPYTNLQKQLLKGPIMAEEDYELYKEKKQHFDAWK